MIYGYARISTPQQSIDRQIRNIKTECENACIVKEAYTGTKINRPEWTKLYKKLKQGDTIIFDEVSRMSRNADEGIQTYLELFDKGIDLIFLKERHINTETYKSALSDKIELTGDDVDDILKGVNSYLKKLATKQIRLAFEQAEKEVEYLHQRTKEGIETARLNGKQIGQKSGNVLNIKKKKPVQEIILQKSRDFEGSNNDYEVMAIISNTVYFDEKTKQNKTYKISRNTFYKYKRELKEMIYS